MTILNRMASVFASTEETGFDALSDTVKTLIVLGVILTMSALSVAVSVWIRHRRSKRNGDII